ncbi:MAG: thioredoxin family protein [Bacteroidetes bacterium]|nr:thioredoxin family protein [Bacteroidota bacterium]
MKLKQKFIFLLIAIVAVSVFSFFSFTKQKSPKQSIQFIEQDWNAALTKAKQNNKLIFLDMYAVWCGPCKMLKNQTFTNKEVATFFNDNFINVSIDAEKGIGTKLSESFQVSAYPTLIFANANGEVVLYTVGFMKPKELMAFAQAAIKKQSKK